MRTELSKSHELPFILSEKYCFRVNNVSSGDCKSKQEQLIMNVTFSITRIPNAYIPVCAAHSFNFFLVNSYDLPK